VAPWQTGTIPISSDSPELPDSGIDRIRLQSDTLTVTILPTAGGNISELVDLRTGRNWLWANPHIPIQRNRRGDDYGYDLDSGGWDEILLSVTADELDLPGNQVRSIPDHGDLIRREWSVVDTDRGGARCDLQVSGELLNYDFRRSVVLAADRAQMLVNYSLTNNDRMAWPWYWCAHALIAVQPDMQIELPAELPFRVESSSLEPGLAEQPQAWPGFELPGSMPLDLSRSFAASGHQQNFAAKIFVKSPDNGSISVAVPGSDEKLTMVFDRHQLPWLGLWINNYGWSGCGSAPYVNLGIEPSTTPYDSVSEAIRHNAVALLEPGETRSWSLAVELAG